MKEVARPPAPRAGAELAAHPYRFALEASEKTQDDNVAIDLLLKARGFHNPAARPPSASMEDHHNSYLDGVKGSLVDLLRLQRIAEFPVLQCSVVEYPDDGLHAVAVTRLVTAPFPECQLELDKIANNPQAAAAWRAHHETHRKLAESRFGVRLPWRALHILHAARFTSSYGTVVAPAIYPSLVSKAHNVLRTATVAASRLMRVAE